MNPLLRQLASLHLNETLIWILLSDISSNNSTKLTNMQIYAANHAQSLIPMRSVHEVYGVLLLCVPLQFDPESVLTN